MDIRSGSRGCQAGLRSGVLHIVALLAISVGGCGGGHVRLTIDSDRWSESNPNPPLSFPLELRWEQQLGPGIVMGPIAWGPLLIVGSTGGDLVVIWAESGKTGWKKDLEGALAHEPVVAGGTVYVPVGHPEPGLVALELATGAVVWRTGLPEPVTAVLSDEERLIVGTIEARLLALGAEDGGVLWTTDLRGQPTTDPVVAGGVVLVGRSPGQIEALSRETGERLQTEDLSGSPLSPLLATEDRLIVATRARTVEMHTLPSLQPVAQRRLVHAPASGPVRGLDALLVPTMNRTLLALSPLDLDLRAEMSLPGLVVAPPAEVAAEVLVLGTLDGKVEARRSDGSVLWETQVKGGLQRPPFAHLGLLYVVTDEGWIYAYSPPEQENKGTSATRP